MNAEECDIAKVEALLDQMDDLHNSGKVTGVRPDAGCLNAALTCMMRDVRRASPHRIESILKKYEAVADRRIWNNGEATMFLVCAAPSIFAPHSLLLSDQLLC